VGQSSLQPTCGKLEIFRGLETLMSTSFTVKCSENGKVLENFTTLFEGMCSKTLQQ